MADNENMGLGFVPDILAKIDEERRVQEQERQIRYAERKRQKVEKRNEIERAAMQICRTAEKVMEAKGDAITAGTVAQLAEAVNHAAAAMQAAETYAEFMPYSGGYCAV